MMEFVLAGDDPCPLLGDDEVCAPSSPARLVLWPRWLALHAHGCKSLPAGVALANDGDLRELLPHLPRLGRIALQFPKWTDGRAYSQARLLRTRHRFAGELRAIGDVIPDMAAQLHRTGFDTAVLRAGESIAVAQRMLRLIPVFYQGDAREPRLRFARPAVNPISP